MFKRILVLAPHTDDGELGCGGTTARLVAEGKEVFQAAFSTAAKSLPTGFPPDTLIKEQKAAAAVLGIPAGNLLIYDLPVREFPANRQEILERLIVLRRELRPDLVLLPALEDIHQDHRTVAEEGIRAFKQCSVMGYELPWNNLAFKNTGFIVLKEEHVQKKGLSLGCYYSQAHRIYSSEEFIFSLARIRGTQIGALYAEMFHIIRLIIN